MGDQSMEGWMTSPATRTATISSQSRSRIHLRRGLPGVSGSWPPRGMRPAARRRAVLPLSALGAERFFVGRVVNSHPTSVAKAIASPPADRGLAAGRGKVSRCPPGVRPA